MKKLLTIMITILLICVTSCERNTPINRDLTANEIAEVNKAFEPIITIDGQDNTSIINPLAQFMMSYYAQPEDMNFEYFLLYFKTENMVNQEPISDEEFLALKQNPNFPFEGTQTLEEMPVPIHRKPLHEVNDFLEKHMNLSIDDFNTDNLVYVDKPYDSFYNFTSDAGFPIFVCTSGKIENNFVYLTDDYSTLTLKKVKNNYYIYSYLEN